MERDVTVLMICPFCGTEHSVKVDMKGYVAWQLDALVGNAFPYLTFTEREQMTSYLCPDCQKEIFCDDVEEEDEGDDILACEKDSLDSTGQWW